MMTFCTIEFYGFPFQISTPYNMMLKTLSVEFVVKDQIILGKPSQQDE